MVVLVEVEIVAKGRSGCVSGSRDSSKGPKWLC